MDADFNLLDTARKVELYGIHMHPAKVISQLTIIQCELIENYV